jgi:hypothetical protein
MNPYSDYNGDLRIIGFHRVSTMKHNTPGEVWPEKKGCGSKLEAWSTEFR